MSPVARRVLARFVESTPVTAPYLLKLIAVMEQQNTSETSEWRGMWGRAIDRLKGWHRRLESQDAYEVPTTLGALIEHLEALGLLESEQLTVLRDAAPTPPRERTKTIVSFADAWRELEKLTGKNVTYEGRLEHRADAPQRMLALAKGLKKLKPAAKRSFQTVVRKILLSATPRGSEDASWQGEGLLRLVLKDRDVSPEVWVYNITHELGHGMEEHLHVDLFAPPWGQPPFISDYAESKPNVEDFAESFAEYVLSPTQLKAKCPEKFADLKRRL